MNELPLLILQINLTLLSLFGVGWITTFAICPQPKQLSLLERGLAALVISTTIPAFILYIMHYYFHIAPSIIMVALTQSGLIILSALVYYYDQRN